MARGVTPEDLASKNAKFINPDMFVELVARADKAIGF